MPPVSAWIICAICSVLPDQEKYAISIPLVPSVGSVVSSGVSEPEGASETGASEGCAFGSEGRAESSLSPEEEVPPLQAARKTIRSEANRRNKNFFTFIHSFHFKSRKRIAFSYYFL